MDLVKGFTRLPGGLGERIYFRWVRVMSCQQSGSIRGDTRAALRCALVAPLWN